jgi:type IV pilus assembly protein PilM
MLSFFGSLWERNPPPMFGLDVSPSGMKLVELDRDRSGRFVLSRLEFEPLARGLIVDGQFEVTEELAAAVRRLVSRSRTKTRRVALAVPASAVITRAMVVPAELREEEVELQIENDLRTSVSISVEEVSVDFCATGPRSASPDDLEVMVAVCRKERVESYKVLAESAGLEPVVLDIESYASRLALSRWTEGLPRQETPAVIALFEIGGEGSALTVLSGDDVLYDREHALGGGQLTRLIARHYDLDVEDAERMKLNGTLPPSYFAEVHEPFVDSLAQEIGNALQYFFTGTSHHKVDHVLLAGGTATLAGLADRVREVTGFDTQVVNPFGLMSLARTVSPQLLNRGAPAYLTACGLAMRRFFS